MKSQYVFQEKKELERLRVQNRLLFGYENPILEQIFSEGHDLAVLDIGCNDGVKTVEWFSSDAVSSVVGLEYLPELAEKAQQAYGNDKFSFYAFDVEAHGFHQKLRALMDEKHIKGFDVIYLSFLLMHLADIKAFLRALRPFLNENGKLFIIEANDSASALSHDPDGLLGEFLTMLKADGYSGNRDAGRYICEELAACGYENICVWHDAISGGEGETEKKKDIFTMFFSYLPEDIMLLLDAQPDNEDYKAWELWIGQKYEKLRDIIMQDNSVISMGMKILTCTKGME